MIFSVVLRFFDWRYKVNLTWDSNPRPSDSQTYSQSTIISTIKGRIDRNSPIIFIKQRFSFTFIYLQRAHTNFSNFQKSLRNSITFPLFYRG